MTTEIDRHKRRLLARLEDLDAQRRAFLHDEARLTEEREPDPLDRARAESGASELEVITESELREILEIEAALRRINDKIYGYCDKCDDLIAPARLEVMPWARLCLDCAEQQERRAVPAATVDRVTLG